MDTEPETSLVEMMQKIWEAPGTTDSINLARWKLSGAQLIPDPCYEEEEEEEEEL